MSRAIPLSAIDHVFTGAGAYPLEFVFAYGGAIDPHRLRASLLRVLESFPPFSSRLGRRDGRYVLVPARDACVLELLESPAAFERAPRRAFVAPVETREGEPLTRLRLTQTPGGSVLGVAVSHAVADGFSYFHFLAAWSRTFRGEAFPAPSHDRERLAPPAAAAPVRLDAGAVHDGCGLFLDAARSEDDRDRLGWTPRVFPAAELRALHAEAQQECPVRLSHNDVLAAWLWREHAAAWTDPAEPLAWLSCPVDVRHLLPGFPPAYCGCAVTLASCAIERERLRGAPLAALARRVRDAVARIDAGATARALATIDGVRETLGLDGLQRLHVVHPRAGLLVTNLSRLPVREIVFDSGEPVAFDVLAPAARCAVVLPARDGLDVRVCAPPGLATDSVEEAAALAGCTE
jgi:hypothetical protein